MCLLILLIQLSCPIPVMTTTFFANFSGRIELADPPDPAHCLVFIYCVTGSLSFSGEGSLPKVFQEGSGCGAAEHRCWCSRLVSWFDAWPYFFNFHNFSSAG